MILKFIRRFFNGNDDTSRLDKHEAVDKTRHTTDHAPARLSFTVRDSLNDFYTVIATRKGSHFSITCTCEAGAPNRHCFHRECVYRRDMTKIVDGSLGDIDDLEAMIRGSDFESSYFLISETLHDQS